MEPEHIGDLIYVPNPDYPYTLTEGAPPHHWMTEQSGRLAEIVEAQLNGEKLTKESIDVVKQYLRQYVERAKMTGDAKRNLLLGQVEKLRTSKDVENFAEELAEFGVEPF